MESEKNNNFDNFMGDQQEKSSEEEARTRRSYDCHFCKRGFTNAQALGGHMNIHRKDKAKAKKNSKEPSSSSSLFSTELSPQFRGGQTTYQVYLPPSPTYYQQSPTCHLNLSPAYYEHGYNAFDYQASWGFQGNSVVEDHHGHGGLDLNLSFGTTSHVDQFGERGNEIDEDDDGELDLELRLGTHHPH